MVKISAIAKSLRCMANAGIERIAAVQIRGPRKNETLICLLADILFVNLAY